MTWRGSAPAPEPPIDVQLARAIGRNAELIVTLSHAIAALHGLQIGHASNLAWRDCPHPTCQRAATLLNLPQPAALRSA